APYVIVTVPTINPEFVFFEDIYDTCGGSDCIPDPWEEIGSGNAAENGFFGKSFSVLATNTSDYLTAVGPILGGQPAPPVDFTSEWAIVVCGGFFDTDLGDRFTSIFNVCHDPLTFEVTVDWGHGEYDSCSPADGFQSAWYIIATMPQTGGSGAATFNENIIDVCISGGCDSPLPVTQVVQADVRDNTSAPALTERYTGASAFATGWNTYFPEVPPPTINFANEDAYLIALDQNRGTGQNKIFVDSVCQDGASGALTVNWTHYMPLAPGGCTDPNSFPSRLVTVFTAPHQNGVSETVFSESFADICFMPPCPGGGVPSIIETDNAAASWTTAQGLDMVCDTAPAFATLWSTLHPTGPPPPVIDFGLFSVIFTTSGFHPDGFGTWNTVVLDACGVTASAYATIREGTPINCPPPLPSPTTPYQLVQILKEFGPLGGPTSYAFNRLEGSACESAGCIPRPAEFLDGGSYPANTNPAKQLYPIGDSADLDAAWDAFFIEPSSQPPKPMLNWDNTDALLYSTGYTPTGALERQVFPDALCVDLAENYVRVDSSEFEPLTCPGSPEDSHPWALVAIPNGLAAGTIDPQFNVVDGCFSSEICTEFIELDHSFGSTYSSPDSKYLIFTDPDLAQRKRDYQGAWDLLGTGPAPGIDELTELDAVIVLIHGWRSSHRGLWDINMTSYCLDTFTGDTTVAMELKQPLSGCVGI
ncbi:MAG: hypothetical protein ABI743_13310, partial [bacterium]